MNSRDAPYLLTDNESRDLLNVQGGALEGGAYGAILKRTGLVTLATMPNTPTSIKACEVVSPTVLIAASGTTLSSVGASGPVTTIATGLTANKRWEFVEAPVISGQGPVYGINGVDPPQTWRGTGNCTAWTVTSGSVAVPNGTMMLYVNNQVFISGVTSNPSRLYWSAIADPTNWDPASLLGAGTEDFDPDDGAPITAIGVVGPYIMVCKPRKLWLLVDPATAVTRRLSNSVGCVAPRSLVNAPEGTYFLSEDRGVYLTNGSKVTPISDKIVNTIYGNGSINISQAAGAYFSGHYYLSLPLNSSTNDTVLDFDVLLQSWWKHSFGSNQFAVWHPLGVAQLYSAKNAALSTTLTAAVPTTTLSSSLTTSSPITSLPVVSSPAIGSGVTVQITSGTHTQAFVTSGTVIAGATSIPVTSQTPNFAYPIGTIVSPRITSLAVNAIPLNLQSGGQVTLTSGPNSQTFTLSANAASGATSLSVTAASVSAAYPMGSTVSVGGIDQTFVPGVYTDNGNNFTWVWRGPWQSPTFYRRRRFPTPYFRKRLRQVRYDGSGHVDFSLAKDFVVAETLISSDIFGYTSGTGGTFAGPGNYAANDGSVFGGVPLASRARAYTLGVANAFSLVFSGTNGDPAVVTSYVLEITDRRDLIVS